jgi:hypothetical protein
VNLVRCSRRDRKKIIQFNFNQRASVLEHGFHELLLASSSVGSVKVLTTGRP